MKKFFALIFLVSLLSAKTIILNQKIKETNNTIIQEEAKIFKNWIIKNYNALMPNFLNVSPQESLIKFSLSYDTQQKKLQSNLNARLILPSFERQITKIKLNNATTKTFSIKLTPIVRIYKSLLTPIIKNSLTFKNDLLIKSFTFNETIYFYFIFNEYKEISTVAIKRFMTMNNVMLKISKTYYSTQKSNLYYLFGLYYYTQNIKKITTYGVELTGDRKHLPFIYSYKVFITYRHLIFGNKFTYFDITPYLQSSKEWQYGIKPFLSVSFNVRF